jgi:transcription-repair coupling factor
MYPKLNINLENKTSYSNTWNFFSKSLIIKENIEQFKKIALIVDSEKSLNQYIKVFDYLKINYEEINSYSSLCNLSHNNSWVFFVLNYTLKEEIIKESQLIHFSQIIEKGSSQDINNIVKKLSELWYDFSDFQNKWTYKKSWDILSITDFSGNTEYKISFWWENIEEIIEIRKNKNNIISTEEIKKVTLWWSKNIFNDDEKKEWNIQNYLKTSKIFTILDSLDFSEFYEENTKILHNFCSFDFVWNKELKTKNLEIENPVIENIENLKEILRPHSFSPNWSYVDIIIYTKNKKTITNFIDYNNLNKDVVIKEIFWNFLKSFKINNKVRDDELSTLQVISDDILWKIFIKKRINKNISADIDLLLKINIWDFVVHIDHWIWIFKWIIKKELPTSNNWKIIIKEYIEIDYKWEDKLFVPITEVSRVNKYIGLENPKLTWLNTTEWIKKLSKVNQEVEDIAQELLEIYSQRQLWKSFSFLPNLKKETDFKASFTYIYTVDQEQVISEILWDMEKQQPMDRLLVWDVGFGKTEVAFNAIYRSFLNKKQSILIAPLVVLAYEHYEKAVDRFKQFWMNIAVITRMESVKKIDEVLKKLNSGEIDLVVWTHKLLSDKINYKDLWLLVVDEEHKFGVKDKEKIKKLKSTIDILSMSATPIPRSLNMALSQIKQMSIIKTPPQGRKDINTIISKFSERVILDWCTSEFKRWWQVYFVHNRVNTLIHFEKVLQWLFPDKKIITTHGQLPWNTLEKRILDFKHKKYDILLTTTVIENGIDFPNVNTIFINDAPIFGISQIHQLRWRVGRSDRLWHCYLLYKKENLWEETAKRLKTIVNFSYLWAGFELAMKDLEIRWGWDLLWSKQSGQSSEIGVNLYLKMIEEKINELKIASHHSVSPKGREAVYGSKINTKIDLQSNIWIPDSYFDSDLDKINFYREIESINNLDDLDELIEDFKQENNVDVFPEEMQNFFDLLKVKLYSNKFNIEHIKKVWINYQIDFNSTTTISKIREFLSLDKQIKFVVITPQRLRCRVKDFTNTEKFLKYLLDIFKWNIWKKRIKLKK